MAKRKRQRRARDLLLLLIVALMAAGFLARRLIAPSVMRHLSHRAPDRRAEYGEPRPMAVENGNAPSEHLSKSDRRALDEVIRQKSEGR